jgi:hypothetical protein
VGRETGYREGKGQNMGTTEAKILRHTRWSRTVIDEARRLFIKGYPPERIARLPNMPSRSSTIHSWKQKEGWVEEKALIFARARELRIEKYAEKFSDMDVRQMELLADLSDEVRKALGGSYFLPPQEIKYLTEAVDKIIKNERLIDDKVTEKLETSVNFGWQEILYATTKIEKTTVIDMPVEIIEDENEDGLNTC